MADDVAISAGLQALAQRVVKEMTHDEIRAAGGPSSPTMTKIIKGDGTVSWNTIRRLAGVIDADPASLLELQDDGTGVRQAEQTNSRVFISHAANEILIDLRNFEHWPSNLDRDDLDAIERAYRQNQQELAQLQIDLDITQQTARDLLRMIANMNHRLSLLGRRLAELADPKEHLASNIHRLTGSGGPLIVGVEGVGEHAAEPVPDARAARDDPEPAGAGFSSQDEPERRGP